MHAPSSPQTGSLGAANLNEVIERTLALLPDLELPGSSRLPEAEPSDEEEGGSAPESTSYAVKEGRTEGRAGAASRVRAQAGAAGGGARRLWVVWQTGQADFERVSGRCSHPRLVRYCHPLLPALSPTNENPASPLHTQS